MFVQRNPNERLMLYADERGGDLNEPIGLLFGWPAPIETTNVEVFRGGNAKNK